jgi:antitoxin FitA
VERILGRYAGYLSGTKNGDPSDGGLIGIQNTVTNALYLMAAHRLGATWPPGISLVVLAFCRQCGHDSGMSVQITIRDVPDAVKDELAARAALQGKSMQEYLRAELERLAARPPVEKVLERIRERKATAGRLSPEEILAHRDADRQ